MIGSDSMDFSLKNIWQTFFSFRQGKKKSAELEYFQYYLENSLFGLYKDLNTDAYQHGLYRQFIATDNKRRCVSVAGIRDRVVHRLLYDHLVIIYNKIFIYDVWSCRPGKGLLGAIERAQEFMRKNKNAYIWRADIKKFFDNVNHNILKTILSFKVKDDVLFRLLENVINSYACNNELERERERVMALIFTESRLVI